MTDAKRLSFVLPNLLDLSDIERVVGQIAEQTVNEMTVKEKAAAAVRCIEEVAKQKGVILKMYKKPSKAK